MQLRGAEGTCFTDDQPMLEVNVVHKVLKIGSRRRPAAAISASRLARRPPRLCGPSRFGRPGGARRGSLGGRHRRLHRRLGGIEGRWMMKIEDRANLTVAAAEVGSYLIQYRGNKIKSGKAQPYKKLISLFLKTEISCQILPNPGHPGVTQR